MDPYWSREIVTVTCAKRYGMGYVRCRGNTIQEHPTQLAGVRGGRMSLLRYKDN